MELGRLLGIDDGLVLGIDGLEPGEPGAPGGVGILDGRVEADLHPAAETTKAAITAAVAPRVIIRCMGNSCEMSCNCRRHKTVLVSPIRQFFVISL